VASFAAGSASAPAITRTGDTNTGIFFPAADTIAFAEGGTESMRLDSSGNLGLGVTPSAWSTTASRRAIQLGYAGGGALYTNAAGSTLSAFVHGAYYDGTNWLYGNTSVAAGRYEITGANGGSTHAWYNSAGGTTGGTISFTQAMTLDASGRLQLGTTSSGAGQRLIVDSSGASTVYNSQFTYSAATNTAYCASTWTHGQSGTATGYVGVGGSAVSNNAFANNFVVGTQSSSPLVFNTNDTERARIDSSGNLLVGTTSNTGYTGKFSIYYDRDTLNAITIRPSNNTGGGVAVKLQNAAGTEVGSINTGASATAYNTSSDYRLKDNIAPMTGALAKVAALKPCTYKWKVDGSDGEGFIAHELAEVVPQCVTGEKDAVDAEGNPKYQGIDTSFLVATLTAAIQEQQALITSQSEIITALTARIEALEA
jgi:hypothetical protein